MTPQVLARADARRAMLAAGQMPDSKRARTQANIDAFDKHLLPYCLTNLALMQAVAARRGR